MKKVRKASVVFAFARMARKLLNQANENEEKPKFNSYSKSCSEDSLKKKIPFKMIE